MSKDELFSVEDGVIIAHRPFIAWCGCGTASRKIENVFAGAGIRLAGVPMARSTSNRNCKRYIEQEGYKDILPALKKGVHAVLISPSKRSGVDVMGANEQATIRAVKELLS